MSTGFTQQPTRANDFKAYFIMGDVLDAEVIESISPWILGVSYDLVSEHLLITVEVPQNNSNVESGLHTIVKTHKINTTHFCIESRDTPSVIDFLITDILECKTSYSYTSNEPKKYEIKMKFKDFKCSERVEWVVD